MESQIALNFSYCADPKFKLNVEKSKTEAKCDICLLKEVKQVRYGEFIVKEYKSNETLRCHYFCLLSATCIPQRGKPFAGITGFLLRDIIDSFREFRDKQCVYCCHRSAPVKCCRKGCERWFHYICGYKNSCLTQFCGAHDSFCDQHLPDEYAIPIRLENRGCEICFELLPLATDANFNPVAILKTCMVDQCPEGLMHRECLQQFAFSAGYKFKCPCCQSKNYTKFAEWHGIFVPNRDASWEREQGAYKTLHKRNCTATNCALTSTKAATDASKVVGCRVCGGHPMHMVCTKLEDPSQYLCEQCMDHTFVKLL